MKASTAIGIGLAIVGPAVGRDDGGQPDRRLHRPAGDPDRVRRHLRRDARLHLDGVDQTHPVALQEGDVGRAPRPLRAGSTCSSRWPRKRAAKACWRWSRASPTSTTSSPAKGCSWSSTAPNRRSSCRCWRTKSTAPRAAPPPTARCSRKRAASRRRWGSSAPSSGSSTCCRTSTSPRPSGPAISGAFIATLYGVGSANVIFLPVASKLHHIADAETSLRELTIEGLLAIQAGDNPRVVADKLEAFVPPEERAPRPRPPRRRAAKRPRRRPIR